MNEINMGDEYGKYSIVYSIEPIVVSGKFYIRFGVRTDFKTVSGYNCIGPIEYDMLLPVMKEIKSIMIKSMEDDATWIMENKLKYGDWKRDSPQAKIKFPPKDINDGTD